MSKWIVDRLAKMSAYDCLDVLSRLSCMIDAAPIAAIPQQVNIMRRLRLPESAIALAEAAMTARARPRALFFPQQVVHLTRMAVLHADPRPSDGFAGGQLYTEFVKCVLAVTELLGEGAADLKLEDNQLSWLLRQTAINHRPDSVALWSRYYDILVRIWPEVATPQGFEAAEAFERYTGLSIQRWLAAGFGLYIQFINYGGFGSEDFVIDPTKYFADTGIQPTEWSSVLDHSARSLEETRLAIIAETEKFGPTTYRCQTFEERPLLRLPGDNKLVIPLAVDSFERHITEGIFWILSDGALAEGLPREHFTGAFGHVFEEWVQRTFERVLPAIGTPRVHRAKPYKGKDGTQVDSTDAVLDYEPDAVFVEVVSKRPTSATLTRGDATAFKGDLEAGVLKKAKQLNRNIRDFRDGRLEVGDMGQSRIHRIFPVIVSPEGFPSMPPMSQIIHREIAQRGWLVGLPPVALLSGEDLAAIEALMEHGVTFLELLKRWRLAPEYSALPFANFVDMCDDLSTRLAGRAQHQESCWQELTGQIRTDLFSTSGAPGAAP